MLTAIFIPLFVLTLLFFYYKGLKKGAFLCVALYFSIPTYIPVFYIAGLPIISFTRILTVVLLGIILLVHAKQFINRARTFPLYKSYVAILVAILLSALASLGEKYFSMNVNIVLSFAFDYFLPSLLLWALMSSYNDVRTASKYISISFGFVILYGLVTHFAHFNPVVDFFKYNNPFPNSKIVFADFSEHVRGNVVGRLQAYYPNAILYGGVVASHLTFSLLYLKPDKGRAFKANRTIIIITILACLLSLFLINSRSSLVCLFASLLVIIILGEVKQSVQIVFIGVSSVFILLTLFGDVLADYLPTINNIFTLGKEGNVSGSSLEMRYTQLVSTLQIYSKKPILGWGFNYIQYLLEAGRTGDLLGAESIIFQLLISGGILGTAAYVFLYSTIYTKLLNQYRKVNKFTAMIGLALFTGYLAFAIMTGDQGLMRFMLIYVAIILKHLQVQRSIALEARKAQIEPSQNS